MTPTAGVAPTMCRGGEKKRKEQKRKEGREREEREREGGRILDAVCNEIKWITRTSNVYLRSAKHGSYLVDKGLEEIGAQLLADNNW
jgi:hypothetical protein